MKAHLRKLRLIFPLNRIVFVTELKISRQVGFCSSANGVRAHAGDKSGTHASSWDTYLCISQAISFFVLISGLKARKATV